MTAAVLTDVSEPEWRAFLKETPGASIFQSPELMRVYSKAEGYHPHILAVESGGRMQALIASVIVSQKAGRLSALTARAIVTGGPLGDASLFPVILAAHDRYAAKVSLLTQIRNLSEPADRKAFEAAGYKWEDHLNFLIDLRKGEKALLAGMSRARRKGIAQAERAGLGLQELRPAELAEAYRILEATYSRAKVPLADRSLFQAALGQLVPEGHLLAFGARLDEDLKAARFVLRWGDTLFDWYAGSDLEDPIHADEWLVWQILKRGIAKGCRLFDFGGAGRPTEPYGPREFKRRFGGTAVSPGRFEKVYRPLTLKAAGAAYKLWRRWA